MTRVGGADNIYAREYDASNHPVGDVFLVSDTPAQNRLPNEHEEPKVVVLDHSYIIAWESDRIDLGTASKEDIIGQAYGVAPCPGPQVIQVAAGPRTEVTGEPSKPFGLTIHGQPMVEVPGYLLADPKPMYHKITQNEKPAGTQYELRCPACVGGGGCVFYLFVYHCPSCTDAINGGWGDMLNDQYQTWESRSCGPKFHDVGYNHPTAIYRTVVPAGTHANTMLSTKVSKYFGFFSVPADDAAPWCNNKKYGPQPITGDRCSDHCQLSAPAP